MGAVIGQVGIGGLLSLVVLLVLTGRLVPRSTLLDAYRERDEWRAAALREADARAEDRDQVRELLEVARVADHVLTSLPRRGEVRRGAVDVDETPAP